MKLLDIFGVRLTARRSVLKRGGYVSHDRLAFSGLSAHWLLELVANGGSTINIAEHRSQPIETLERS